MDTTIIKKAGLTEEQAKVYVTLLERGPLSAQKIATAIKEKRPNTYAILDRLMALGLAQKSSTHIGIFELTHPNNLELLAEKRRRAMAKNEQEVKNNISPLIDIFYAHSGMLGARTIGGLEGIKEIYADNLHQNADVYVLRTVGDANLAVLGEEYINTYRTQLARQGKHTYSIGPFTKHSQQILDAGKDKEFLFHRITIPQDLYQVPVKLSVYGRKTGFTIHDKTQMSVIIDSAVVAEIMRFMLINLGVNFAQKYVQHSTSSDWAEKQLKTLLKPGQTH
jgi:sugar-specific transcriptional regulator TrmB